MKLKKKIKELIEKYGQGKGGFIIDGVMPAEDILITFDSSDLLFALHDATLVIKATKNKNSFKSL